MFPEIPQWVKNPDFDRVRNGIPLYFQFIFMSCSLLIISETKLLTVLSLKIDWLNKFLELLWPYLDKVTTLEILANSSSVYKIR